MEIVALGPIRVSEDYFTSTKNRILIAKESNMRYWVYIHTCKANNKKYVGITTKIKPEYRWGKNGEGYLYNDHFRSAILKHGWDNFEHEVFEVGSKEEMYRKEVELISFYHSNDPEYGYNNSTGGEKSGLGCKRSEEARKRIAESKKGKILSEEHKRHIAEAHRGKSKPHSEEARKHMAEAQKKVHADPEYRKRISEAQKKVQKKVHADPEYRRKISEACRNQPRIKIKLPDGTILERTKNVIVSHYINKGKKFEYVD